jgi:MFS family permease
VGAAGLFSGALIILAHVVPLHKRPTFMGAIGGMWGIASVAGPLLGGVFTVYLPSPLSSKNGQKVQGC